jgi:ribonuclease P protein component
VLPKQLRNIHQKEFKPLLSSRLQVGTKHMQIKFCEGSRLVFSVVVPKKIFKKAHDRFRVKRRIYSILSTHIINNTSIIKGFYLLSIKNSAILSLSSEDLVGEVIQLIKELTFQTVESLTKKRGNERIPSIKRSSLDKTTPAK